MGTLETWGNWLDALRESSEILVFIEDNLLRFTYVGLAFGFAMLLVEIRLPLRYYWDLPTHLLRKILEILPWVKSTPVWGRVLESETERPVSLTAVELLDKDSRERIKITFSNRLGEYGFSVNPGEYILRGVKNYYTAPPFYDPENIQLESTTESFASSVVVAIGDWPHMDIVVQQVTTQNLNGPIKQVLFYGRAFVMGLGNGLLALSIIASWYGWAIMQTTLYGVLLAVGIVFLFIKLYILETVGGASSSR